MFSLILATVIITSSLDLSSQPALFYNPSIISSVPLLVALHTWGGDYSQSTAQEYANWCYQHNWAFIHPNFRGVNNNPMATGSPLAIQDIVDAVNYAKSHANISNVYLVGASGGGHAALLVYAQHPEIFNAASVFVPITDLRDWYYETNGTIYNNYAQNIISSTGGIPGQSLEIDTQYAIRSPMTWLTNTLPITLNLNVGIFDGHTGSVKVSHSLKAFNALAEPEDRISSSDIDYITQNSIISPNLQQQITCNNGLMSLFKRKSNNTELMIFNGTHEINIYAALEWLENIENGQQNSPGKCSELFIPLLTQN